MPTRNPQPIEKPKAPEPPKTVTLVCLRGIEQGGIRHEPGESVVVTEDRAARLISMHAAKKEG